MRRRRRPRSSRRSNRPAQALSPRTIAAAGILGLLALGATLPFGGVSAWATEAILLAALAAAVGLLLLNGRPTPAASSGSAVPNHSLLFVLAVAWLAWALFQLLPMPTAVVRVLQPGWAVMLEAVPTTPATLSLAVNRGGGFHAVGLWAVLAIVAAATAAGFRDRHAARLLAHVIAALGAFQAFAALIIPGFESSWWMEFSGPRLRGTFSGPNTFGNFLALTVPVTLGLLLTLYTRLIEAAGGRWKRLLTLPSQHHTLFIETVWIFMSLLAQVVSLIGSGSRGAVTATLVPSLLLFLAYLVAVRGARGSAMKLAGLLLLAVFIMAAGGGLYLLMQRFEADALWDRGLPSRVALWQAALRLIRVFPLGVGAGSYALVLPVFQPIEFGGYRVDHAHNDYLQWTGEFGLPGMVLLAGMLAALSMRAVATARVSGAHTSAWIWRGAAMAVVAALAHAVVDFNLMARPGVRTLFFIVCGLMLGAPRSVPAGPAAAESAPAATSESGETRHRRRRPRRWRPSFALLVVVPVAAAIAIPAVRRLRTVRAVEGARVALTLPADPYAWLPAPWIAPDRAMHVLETAADRMPGQGRFRADLAYGRLARLEQERQLAIDAARIAEDAYRPEHLERIDAMVDLAMGWELQQAMEASLHDAYQAIDRAPWDQDSRTFAARLHAQLADRTGPAAAAGHRLAAVSQLQAAQRLAPHDIRVLTESCHVLAQVHSSAREDGDTALAAWAAGELARLGHWAVHLDGKTTVQILEAWAAAGLLADRLADLEDEPVAVLREIYRYFERTAQAEGALRVLDRLAVAYSADEMEADDPALLFVERERYRWMLRQGEWQRYRETLAQRRDLWQQRQQQALTRGEAASSSDLAYRLRLRDIDHRMGLNVANLLALAFLEWDRGAVDAAMGLLGRALALGCGLPERSPEEMAEARTWLERADSMRGHFAPQWLAARLMLADRQPRTAALRYERLLENPRLPLRFRHRIRLEAATAWTEAGSAVAAINHLEAALGEAATDPDVLSRLIDHDRGAMTFRGSDGLQTTVNQYLEALHPPIQVKMRFMGERVELVGWAVEPYGAAGRMGTRLRLVWRFYDRVPSDLAIAVIAGDTEGFVFFRRTVAFGRELPHLFSAGEPRVGCLLPLDVILPPRALAGRQLQIVLTAERRRMASDEGMPRIDIRDWAQTMTPPPEPELETAEPDI